MKAAIFGVMLCIIPFFELHSDENEPGLARLHLVEWSSDDPRWRWADVRIYLVDESQKLQTIWSTEAFFSQWKNIRLFTEAGTLLLSKEMYRFGAEVVYSLSLDCVIGEVDFADSGIVRNGYQIITGEPLGQLRVAIVDSIGGSARVRSLSPDKSTASTPFPVAPRGELRLSGFHSSGLTDIVTVPSPLDTSTWQLCRMYGVDTAAFPVPKNLLFDSRPGWNLVAQEEKFLALSNGGLLLTFDRTNHSWHYKYTANIGGFWPLGGWMLARVDMDGPNRDGPGAIVLMDPLSDREINTSLTGNAEILLIESESIFFRTGDSLCEGTLADSGIVAMQVILSDARISHVHWAYRK